MLAGALASSFSAHIAGLIVLIGAFSFFMLLAWSATKM
jgi:hypothetical protein